MSDLKFVMLCNITLYVAYFICVTYAAVSFEKPSILWWYTLILFFSGWKYSSDPTENSNKKTGDK